jgi:hypothetical protein
MSFDPFPAADAGRLLPPRRGTMRHQRPVRPGEALCPDRLHPVHCGLPKVGPSALARIGDLDHRSRALFHSNHLEGQLAFRAD